MHEGAAELYDQAQRLAWAPVPPDYERWAERFDQAPPFVAELAGERVGFLTLEPDGHVDVTYVDPGFHRLGVGTSLLRHAESVARQLGLERLYVEASHAARPLFEGAGFVLDGPNLVERGGVRLTNWRMSKSLGAREA